MCMHHNAQGCAYLGEVWEGRYVPAPCPLKGSGSDGNTGPAGSRWRAPEASTHSRDKEQGLRARASVCLVPRVAGSGLAHFPCRLQARPAVDNWEPQRGVRTVRNRRVVGKVFPVTASQDILREAGLRTCPQLDPAKASSLSA